MCPIIADGLQSYTEDGIRELVGEVGPLQPELVVMEATGGSRLSWLALW